MTDWTNLCRDCGGWYASPFDMETHRERGICTRRQENAREEAENEADLLVNVA